jgi:hypothetical protein
MYCIRSRQLPMDREIFTTTSISDQQAAEQGAATDRLQPCVSLVPRSTSGFQRRVSLVVRQLCAIGGDGTSIFLVRKHMVVEILISCEGAEGSTLLSGV